MIIKSLSRKASLFLMTCALVFAGCVHPEPDPGDEVPGEPVPSAPEDIVPAFDCPGDELFEIPDGYDGSVPPDHPCWDRLIYSFNVNNGVGSEGAMRIMGSDPACLLKLSIAYIPSSVSFIEIILDGAHQGYFEVDRDQTHFEVYLPKLGGKKQIFLVYSDNQGDRVGSLNKYILDFGS